jgi:hypothetical protein
MLRLGATHFFTIRMPHHTGPPQASISRARQVLAARHRARTMAPHGRPWSNHDRRPRLSRSIRFGGPQALYAFPNKFIQPIKSTDHGPAVSGCDLYRSDTPLQRRLGPLEVRHPTLNLSHNGFRYEMCHPSSTQSRTDAKHIHHRV